jgi:uncharacterized membrane protein
MATQIKSLRLFSLLVFLTLYLNGFANTATDSVTLYTPFTKISVPPGQSIDYIIDVINKSTEIKNVDISLSGMPRGWNYIMKSGDWNIGQLSILPGQKSSLSLKVEVPLNANKGTYRFKVVADGVNPLVLEVNISQQGTFRTEFTTEQPNMQGHATSTFTFNANLKNRTADKQTYALMADAARGWNVVFKNNYQQVTSVNSEPNSTQSITIEIKAPEKIEAGRYKIPVSAVTNNSSASLDLEVVVTGSFSMELTTPTGLVSTDVTAGEEKRLELVINNTGTSQLTDITMNATTPVNWDVKFDPKKVNSLLPGKTAQVFATIKADKKAIPGDYVTNFEAKTPESSSKVSFRVSVETPMLWGWIGVLVIIVALGSVYYLFRKFGRR